jgi:hypothetical protein
VNLLLVVVLAAAYFLIADLRYQSQFPEKVQALLVKWLVGIYGIGRMQRVELVRMDDKLF